MATRQSASNVRLQVQIQQQNIMNEVRYFRESREAFMQALDDSQKCKLLMEKHTQLREDEERLEKSLKIFSTLTVTLSRLDMDILNEDEKQQNPHGTNLLANLPTMAPSTVLNLQKVAKDDVNDEMHPLLRQYFDLLGDIRLLRERLEEEIPYEHAEKKAHREMLVDQDLGTSEAGVTFNSARNIRREDSAMNSAEESQANVPLEVHETESDKAFAAECRDEIEKATAMILTKERLANDLRQRCIEFGLDPDPKQWKRTSETASTQGDTREAADGGIEHWLQNVEQSSEQGDDDSAVLKPSDLSSSAVEEGLVLGHSRERVSTPHSSGRHDKTQDSRGSTDTGQPSCEAVANMESKGDLPEPQASAEPRSLEASSTSWQINFNDPFQPYLSVGRVFRTTTSPDTSKDRSMRRLLVVVERQQDFCLTLPIRTYKRSGVAQRRNKPDYVVVFSGPQPPELLPAERATRSELSVRYPAIRIVASHPSTHLPEHARLYLGEERRVTDDARIKDFGSVHEHSLTALKTHYQAVKSLKQQMKLGTSQLKASTSPTRSGSFKTAGNGTRPEVKLS